MRKLLKRFAGEDLEVALEATTGWRFFVEELDRAGGQAPGQASVSTKKPWAAARVLMFLSDVNRR